MASPLPQLSEDLGFVVSRRTEASLDQPHSHSQVPCTKDWFRGSR